MLESLKLRTSEEVVVQLGFGAQGGKTGPRSVRKAVSRISKETLSPQG